MKTHAELRAEWWAARARYEANPRGYRSAPAPETISLVGLLPAWTLSRIDEGGKTFLEQVGSGTFRKTIEGRADVTLRIDHNGPDIASVADGTLDLFEGADGLHFKATVNSSAAVERALDDDRVGVSPSIRVTSDKWTETEDGRVRTITGGDLLHLALTARPAYSSNWVAREGFVMRSLRATSAPRFDAASNALRREAILRLRAEQIGVPRFTDFEIRRQEHRELCAAVWRNNHRRPAPLG